MFWTRWFDFDRIFCSGLGSAQHRSHCSDTVSMLGLIGDISKNAVCYWRTQNSPKPECETMDISHPRQTPFWLHRFRYITNFLTFEMAAGDYSQGFSCATDLRLWMSVHCTDARSACVCTKHHYVNIYTVARWPLSVLFIGSLMIWYH